MSARLVKLLLKTQWPLFAGPCIALTACLGTQNAFELYVDPDHETILMIIGLWSAVGVMFGVLTNVFEQLPSHREFMIHRGLAPRSYFMTKLCVTLALAAVPWFGSVLASTWLWRAFAPNGIFAEGFGVTRLLALASSGLAGFGFGVWCATLRRDRGTYVANTLIVAAALGLAEYLLVSATRADIAPSTSRFVVFQILACALFVTAAYLNYQRQHDPDRPVPLAAQLGHASVVGLALTALLFVLAPAIQFGILRNFTGYPVIDIGSDGRMGLFDVVRDDDRETMFPVDERHERAGESVERAGNHSPVYTPRSLAYYLDRSADDSIPPRPMPRRDLRLGVAIQSLLFDPFVRLYIERPAGRLVLDRQGLLTFNNDRSVWIEPLRHELRRPDARTFGPRTMPLGVSSVIGRNDFSSHGGDKGPMVLGDPDDGTLWRVTFKTVPSGVEAVLLPNGDRFVAWAWRADARDRSGDSGDLSAVVIQGDRGNYVFDEASRVVPATVDAVPWRTILRAGPSLLVRVSDGEAKPHVEGADPSRGATEVRDPFFVRIELLADDDSVAFAHDYAPRRPQERAARAACLALALLRPPLAADALVPGLDFDRHTKGFANPWLTLILACLLASQAALLLRGRGACPKRMSLWMSMNVVLGPGAFIAFLLLERKTAFVRMPREAVETSQQPRVIEPAAVATT